MQTDVQAHDAPTCQTAPVADNLKQPTQAEIDSFLRLLVDIAFRVASQESAVENA